MESWLVYPTPRNLYSNQHPFGLQPIQEQGPPEGDQDGIQLIQRVHIQWHEVYEIGRTPSPVKIVQMVWPTWHRQYIVPCRHGKTLSSVIIHNGNLRHHSPSGQGICVEAMWEWYVLLRHSGGSILWRCQPHLHFWQHSGQTCILNIVVENCYWFTPRQFIRAKLARYIYTIMGRILRRDLQNMMHSHTVKNCSITIEDITVANTIFGPDLGLLKGKTVIIPPSPMFKNYASVPASMRLLNRHINIAVGVIYVNYLMFLVIVSWSLRCTTLMYIKSRKRSQLVTRITKVI